ncbi:MAG TPA: chemotaxis protein CheX [Phycisphaerae bacterium]|nr:chemotaxis protein CheX [Phycisphaerae bacterium]HNU46859.1 chemotaxis protein CheX [Phycisphaerae bacterium]
MDVRYINSFVGATCNVFETMVGMPVAVDKPTVKSEATPSADVSGVIGFSGDATGSVVLAFSFDTAAKIASAFAGAQITPQHPDFADAIGELANMVAGGAKSKFDGFNINISLPNVIVGRDHNVCPSRSAPRIVIPCRTEAGFFYVEVGMVVEKKVQRAAAVAAGVTP